MKNVSQTGASHCHNGIKMKFAVSKKSLTFKKPARTSRGEYTEHEMYVITIEDERLGRRGVGELAPLPDLSCDRGCYPDAKSVEALIHEAFDGGFPNSADADIQHNRLIYNGEARGAMPWQERLRPYPALLFALETAIADLYRTPELYDTPFARGEAGIPFNGLVWMDSYDNMLRQMQDKIEAGFQCIKLKIGAIDFERELDLIRIIREHYPKERIEIRVDANGAFTAENVMQRLEALARYDLHSIEQPIRPLWHESGAVKSWSEMAELCRVSPLPIALDEELIGVNDTVRKIKLLETIRPQYIVLKPMLHGGISGTREWHGLAKERGINSWITSALESNIGLQTVALLAASIYGSDVDFPQGLGTGQLFVENIPMQVQSVGSRIFIR